MQNINRHLSGLASGRAGKDENVDAAKANAELKESQKRLTELRIATMQGDLISLPDIEAAWTEISLAVKQLFLSMPARARFDLPHLTGADQKKLDELARDMLTEVAFEGEIKMPAGAEGTGAKKAKAKKAK